MEPKCEFAKYCPFVKILGGLTSSKTGRHLLNAKREVLLACKSLIEKEVEKMDEEEKEGKRAKRVKVK